MILIILKFCKKKKAVNSMRLFFSIAYIRRGERHRGVEEGGGAETSGKGEERRRRNRSSVWKQGRRCRS